MAWTSKTKDISITSTKDHPAQTPGLVARAPTNTTVTFTSMLSPLAALLVSVNTKAKNWKRWPGNITF
jgi:hypothetical protein